MKTSKVLSEEIINKLFDLSPCARSVYKYLNNLGSELFYNSPAFRVSFLATDSHGYSDVSIHKAFKDLLDTGLIEKVSRGCYKIKN